MSNVIATLVLPLIISSLSRFSNCIVPGWFLEERKKEKNVYRLFIERATIFNLNNNSLSAPYGNHDVLPSRLRDITQ